MFIFKMHLLAPFTDQNDRSSYPFIYFNQWIPHTFIYLRPEKGTPSGWSIRVHYRERPYQGEGGVHVSHLNFKMSRVSVYKCLSLIVGFAVSVTIWPREVVSCRISFYALSWAMSLVGIYPGRASREYSPSGVLNLIDIVH